MFVKNNIYVRAASLLWCDALTHYPAPYIPQLDHPNPGYASNSDRDDTFLNMKPVFENRADDDTELGSGRGKADVGSKDEEDLIATPLQCGFSALPSSNTADNIDTNGGEEDNEAAANSGTIISGHDEPTPGPESSIEHHQALSPFPPPSPRGQMSPEPGISPIDISAGPALSSDPTSQVMNTTQPPAIHCAHLPDLGSCERCS